MSQEGLPERGSSQRLGIDVLSPLRQGWGVSREETVGVADDRECERLLGILPVGRADIGNRHRLQRRCQVEGQRHELRVRGDVHDNPGSVFQEAELFAEPVGDGFIELIPIRGGAEGPDVEVGPPLLRGPRAQQLDLFVLPCYFPTKYSK